MPLTTPDFLFSRKVRLFIKAVFLILFILWASLSIYKKEDRIVNGIYKLSHLRIENKSLNFKSDLIDDGLSLYMLALKDVTNASHPDLDIFFSDMTVEFNKSGDFFQEDSQLFRDHIIKSYESIVLARSKIEQGQFDEARSALYNSYSFIMSIRDLLVIYENKFELKYAQQREILQNIILEKSYEQFWVLMGCFLFILVFAASMIIDILIPIQGIAKRIILASQNPDTIGDYVFNKVRRDEIGVVQGALNELFFKIQTNIQRSHQAELLAQQRLAAIEVVNDGIGIVDKNGHLTYANKALMDMHGITDEMASRYIGRSWKDLYSLKGQIKIDLEVLPQLERDGVWQGQSHILRKDGIITVAEISLVNLPDGGFVGTSRNITEKIQADHEKRELQKQFIQAQKLESVGRLTGGIAHDFNNILTIINGNLDMIVGELGPQNNLSKIMQTTRRSIVRGAELTQRLLAFSRSQTLDPKVINLNNIIPEATMMIIRAIGEQIEIIFNLSDDLALIKLDIGQFENALINLSINARDAMPDGGYIRIKTENITLKNNDFLHDGKVIPGDYVMVEVSDTGCGIPEHLQTQIFDPFYTTKDVGEGSGLGLSMVYGFVKQSGGHISVESDVNVGTSIKMMFPRLHGGVEDPMIDDTPHIIEAGFDLSLTGTEIVLMVEDERDILEMNKELLEKLGYIVHCASNGDDALLLSQNIDHLDLLVTDIIMPGNLNGYNLALKIKESFPLLKTLFISGYAPHKIVENVSEDINILSKPYFSRQLAERIKKSLSDS